ncbi:MAG: hypothetical protein IT236_19075 [Bacteroidia bacterium]|nr:hypothetical protein [Bacteroidia bacterium]
MKKRNLLNILGFLIGILGIALSVYYYELSKREKDPTFIIDPIKFEILKSSSTHLAPIKILTLNGDEIKRDVTSLTFYFWNKGKEPIRPVDLLTNINFILSNNAKIIDFKILKRSRDVCKINLFKHNSDTLRLDFKILEENDGFTGQVIFEGPETTQLNIATDIVGVKSISGFAASNYFLLGKTIANILLGIVTIFVMFILLAITSPSKDPPIVELKHTKKYQEDEEFRKKVDAIDQLQSDQNKLWSTVHDLENNADDENEKIKADLRLKRLVNIGIFIGVVIVISILIFAWHNTREEIENNPINYIPDSIRPK